MALFNLLIPNFKPVQLDFFLGRILWFHSFTLDHHVYIYLFYTVHINFTLFHLLLWHKFVYLQDHQYRDSNKHKVDLLLCYMISFYSRSGQQQLQVGATWRSSNSCAELTHIPPSFLSHPDTSCTSRLQHCWSTLSHPSSLASLSEEQ